METRFTLYRIQTNLAGVLLLLSLLIGPMKGTFGQNVPELIYYKFDGTGTNIPNLASSPVGLNPALIVGSSLTQGPGGQFGNGLIGTGGTSTTNYVNTGWPLSLSGSWTISFYLANVPPNPPTTTLWYFLGESSTGLRCFTNGVAGANNLILRATGMTDVLIPNSAVMAPNVVHFVYDQPLNVIRGYLNGVLVATVNQGPLNLVSSNNFILGGWGSAAGHNGTMDEFRIYNRALTATEISQTWNQSLPIINAANDAGVVSIDSPAVLCEGVNVEPVVVTVRNFGKNQIDNVLVEWSVDGVAQTPYAYTGLIDTLGGASPREVQVTIGTYTFSLGTYDIKAWTSMPNGMIDTVNNNDSMSVNLVIHPNPVVDLGGDTVFCAGSTPFLILDASQPGASYQWSTGSQGGSVIITQPGIYSVTVTSQAGCTGRDTMEVKTAPSPVVSINDTIVCEGTSVVLDAGNPGSTYLWSDNSTGQTLTVSTTGLYQVTVTNQDGCSADGIAVVTVNPNPVVDLGNDTATHIWAEVTLDAGNPGATYLWSTGETTRTITVNVHSTYSVTVTDANGCEGIDSITIIGTGIHTVEGLGKWSVFPNPATDATHIRLELVRGGKITLELYDPSGRRVWEQVHGNATGTETISIPMHHLAQGMYLLRVRLDGQLIGTSGVGRF